MCETGIWRLETKKFARKLKSIFEQSQNMLVIS